MFLPLILFTCFGIFLVYKYWTKRNPNFPPGPNGIPLLGSFHITRGKPHLVCSDLTKTYGPIISLKFGNYWSVMMHDTKVIREVFADLGANGRRATEATTFLIGDEFGILQASGDVWSEQRRFAMRTLRDFGFGRASMEEMIVEEAAELVDWLKSQAGAPVELKRRFGLAVVNSLWRILTGQRYDQGDPALVDILDKLECAQRLLLNFTSPFKTVSLFFYPTIAKFFPSFSGWHLLEEAAASRTALFDQIILEHRATVETGNPRDFIDVYLEEIGKTTNQASSFHEQIGINSLTSVISDLFLAGTDTTSATLLWTVMYLLHFPKVQEKLQQELDTVLEGRTRPTLNDRKKLPYLESFIMEVLRASSILPLGIAHFTTHEMKIGDYTVPAETIVNANLYHVHHDPAVWGDPEVFRPERFLNPDGSCMGRHESLIPFSVGRRVCMGEHLARDTLFIFIGMIVQNFTVVLPPGEEMPSMEAKTGQVTLQPVKFKVTMSLRGE